MTDIAHRPSTPPPSARFLGTHSDLRALRAELERNRRFRVEQLRELTAAIRTGVPHRRDDPQGAVTLALRTAATAVLADTVDALSRIDSQRYGVCEECGTAIPLPRLQALPMIRWCGSCQHANEGASGADVVPRHTGGRPAAAPDIVDVWGHGSFPASDPPANW